MVKKRPLWVLLKLDVVFSVSYLCSWQEVRAAKIFI